MLSNRMMMGASNISGGGGPLVPGNLFIEAETDISDINGTHTITVEGAAALSATKFSSYNSSTKSVFLDDGAGYLTAPDHADFDFGSGDFTIDFTVFFNSLRASSGQLDILMSQHDTGSRGWSFGIVNNAGVYSLNFTYSTNGTTPIDVKRAWEPTLDTEYHLALIRDGANVKFFVDGVQEGPNYNISTNTIFNSTTDFRVGADSSGGTPRFKSDVYIDNVRLVKDTALWTTNFTLSDSGLFYT